MATPRRFGLRATPAVARGQAWQPSLMYLLVAAALVAGWLSYVWAPEGAPAPQVSATPLPAPRASSAAPLAQQAAAPLPPPPLEAPVPSPSPDRAPDPNDLAQHVPPGQAPSMGEVIKRLHQAGVRTGLGAFSPPGTRPPLVGLAVPADFTLPDGFVRHHQTTDDGQDIEPILMFAPDRPFFDAAGRPIEIPKDRVVPPEWAPPGLPLRRIVVPPPLQPGSAGS
jgi:hypothetical protein